MPNSHVYKRLEGILQILSGVHAASAGMSSATKGSEREAFIDSFLSEVLPPVFRFGTGDATDAEGRISGQLDVVIEFPFSPTLPAVGGGKTRLYLAESIAAVVEVKSNASNQWAEAVATADKLAGLKREFGASMVMGPDPTERIPLFVAGYTGWKTPETIQKRLAEAPSVAGVLVLDSQLFVTQKSFGGMCATGPWSLWGLVSMLHYITNSLQAASTDPVRYAT